MNRKGLLPILLVLGVVLAACTGPEDRAGYGNDTGVEGNNEYYYDDEYYYEEDPEEEAPAPTPVPPGMQDLRIVDFDTYGDETEIHFTVEPGEESVLFYLVGAGQNDEVAVYSITGPGGELLYSFDFNTEEISGSLFDEFIAGTGEVAFFLPVAPQYPLEPGEYIVVIGTDGVDYYASGAVFKRGDFNAPQALDYNIWLASTAEEPYSQDFLLGVKSAINGILAPHNLQVGQFITREAPSSFLDAYLNDEDQTSVDETQIPEVCRAAAAEWGTNRAINIVVVDWIRADEDGIDDGEITGVSSGLPGIIFESRAGTSCVVASYMSYGSSLAEHGATWLHEGSHFMSLLHTTEEDGLIFDKLQDTPECPYDGYDTNDDGYVDDYECDIEGGANNFIFYSGVPDFMPFVMTADQAWILARHPLFHPLP